MFNLFKRQFFEQQRKTEPVRQLRRITQSLFTGLSTASVDNGKKLFCMMRLEKVSEQAREFMVAQSSSGG
jgi:hypothetical protein